MSEPFSPTPREERAGCPFHSGTQSIAGPASDPQRRRVRFWAIASASMWILTALGFAGLLWTHLVFVHPAVHEQLTGAAPADADLRQPSMLLIMELKALMVWPILLVLAAGCTTIFIIVSRNAVLHEIRTSMDDIRSRIEVGGGPG